jgi:hypothetical protein
MSVRLFFLEGENVNRYRIRVLTALFTFTVGVFATLAWFIHNVPHPAVASVPVNTVNAPTPKILADSTTYHVTFCELIHNPTKYDQKIINMRAFHVIGGDASYFHDSSCKEDGVLIRAKISPTMSSCFRFR